MAGSGSKLDGWEKGGSLELFIDTGYKDGRGLWRGRGGRWQLLQGRKKKMRLKMDSI